MSPLTNKNSIYKLSDHIKVGDVIMFDAVSSRSVTSLPVEIVDNSLPGAIRFVAQGAYIRAVPPGQNVRVKIESTEAQLALISILRRLDGLYWAQMTAVEKHILTVVCAAYGATYTLTEPMRDSKVVITLPE